MHRKVKRFSSHRDFSLADFPTELQLELMEEDMGHDEIAPDEEQLEVLEDIWLKAGEIDIEEASIYDAGYKVSQKRKGARGRAGGASASGAERRPRPRKKKQTREPSINELHGGGPYAACESNSKKTCGTIVAPVELLGGAKAAEDSSSQGSGDTAGDQLMCSMLDEECDRLGLKRKKHKHKEHCKKHKKKYKG